MNERLQVVEICAGAGGQALGLARAGFAHRIAVEYDTDAAETLRSNLARLHPVGDADARVVVGDVTDPAVWTPETCVGVDLLAGGPPCPPFSDAGRRLGAGDDRDLYAWSIGLVGRIRPRAVLLENVKGLSRPRFAGYRQAVADRLAAWGYAAEWRLLTADDYGMPQTRPRCVLVAIRDADAEYFRWPRPRPTTSTVGDTLRDLMSADGWPGADAWAASAQAVAPTIVGGSRRHGGADLGPTGTRRRWATLGVNGSSVAESAPDAGFPVAHVPRLTPTMLARLQGFPTGPDEWVFSGKKTSRCRQIGNAFPPPVAEALGTSIAAALRHEGAPRTPSEPVVHCPVVKALIERQGRPVTVIELHRLGLTDRRIDEAVAHLRRDFDVVTSGRGGSRQFRLHGWRRDAVDRRAPLPLWDPAVDLAA